ncbi:radical SAM protein [uncultured Anaerococcus sp.]|uniref:radical SAM protein n=1 Tax=uncultured Anaerococcus sp. TaxID=293428 RepID=UPI0026294604|nr:radical SAM protein [uncultured Anaerococcus sp.]
MKDKKLDINEIFYSIDGEGITAGQLAIFIRLNGCNLRCSYCDTAYALETKENYIDFNQIFKLISGYPCKNITITGGEPLYQDGTIDFIKELTSKGYRVNIETNGSISINRLTNIDNTIVTLDIKTYSSDMEKSNLYENLDYLRECDVSKFVVGDKDDLDFTYKVVNQYKPKGNIFLSPVYGSIEPADIVNYMKSKDNEKVRLQLQMHKYIWDPDKRGV